LTSLLFIFSVLFFLFHPSLSLSLSPSFLPHVMDAGDYPEGAAGASL